MFFRAHFRNQNSLSKCMYHLPELWRIHKFQTMNNKYFTSIFIFYKFKKKIIVNNVVKCYKNILFFFIEMHEAKQKLLNQFIVVIWRLRKSINIEYHLNDANLFDVCFAFMFQLGCIVNGQTENVMLYKE